MECDIAALIQQQVDAYNGHDAAAFAELYAPEAEVVSHPEAGDNLKGRVAIRDLYGRMFAHVPDLKVQIAHRTVLDHHVVDEEVLPLAGQTLHAVVVYRVENCLIQRADIYE